MTPVTFVPVDKYVPLFSGMVNGLSPSYTLYLQVSVCRCNIKFNMQSCSSKGCVVCDGKQIEMSPLVLHLFKASL